MLRNLGTVEILIISGVLMLFFGSKRLPELTKSLGKASKEFKKGLRGNKDAPESKVADVEGGGDNV